MSVNDIALSAAGSSGPATYVDDVFSTYLYTGNGSTQTITNGIDLAGKGGMVWFKARSTTGNNTLSTTGITGRLLTDTTGALNVNPVVDSYNSNGFTTLTSASTPNQSGVTFASWTFRKAPKFFDVVTYTGTGSARTIAHNLGSVPGMIIVKNLTSAVNWSVYHRSIGNTDYLSLNTTDAKTTSSSRWNNTSPTSAEFTVGATNNTSGATYVAYLFAHDAGGFGTSGTDNVISCGSYTGGGAGNFVTLGYEPQYVLIKNVTTGSTVWVAADIMRGASQTSYAFLYPSQSNAEAAGAGGLIRPEATGFSFETTNSAYNQSGSTYIYMAIRRPMKPPTSGTEVFSPVIKNAVANSVVTTGFPVDLSISAQRSKAANEGTNVIDRLRGSSTTRAPTLQTNRDVAEYVWTSNGFGLDSNTTLVDNLYNPVFGVTSSVVYWNFRRATGFFDVVCYTGTGSARTVAHNLGVAPELIIFKNRVSTTINWNVNVQSINTNNWTLSLNTDEAVSNKALFSTAPTSSLMTFTGAQVNVSGNGYVAYLFASVAGVSKVFSFTGNGSSQTINCGFTSGARLILIKRTDSTGDWYIWDSSRGIVSGNDPHLSLNSTAAEVTTDDSIDPDSSGFVVNQLAATNINVSSATYIGLAIA